MKKLYFYGASDDLFEFDQEDGTGLEIDCYGTVAIFKVTDGVDGLFVAGLYAPKQIDAPVWSVGIAPLGEDVPLPEWPITCRTAESGYSTALMIEAPDSVVVEEVEA